MVSLDDASLLHVRSKLGAQELHDGQAWHSQVLSDIFYVSNVCLDSIQSRLLCELHLRHFVPEGHDITVRGTLEGAYL